MPDIDMSVNLAGMTMKNPIVAASGAFGFGAEYGEFYDISRLGGICVKGLTPKRREGNPPPRIAETPMGMLNSVGLQNPGVDAFIEKELPQLKGIDIRVIAMIGMSCSLAIEAALITSRVSPDSEIRNRTVSFFD